MRKVYSLIAAMCFCALFTFKAQAAVIVGKVDVQKVLVSVKQGQKVRDQLKRTFDERQKTLKAEEEKIRKMQEEFKKKGLVMNGSAKRKKEDEINQKIMALQQKSVEYQKEIQEMENKYKRPILERIKDIVEDVSKSAGVDITFEASTAPIIYAKDDKDLTNSVISAYNKKFPN